ncbi:hypothetical protein [Lewinella cohaerens]|uniref:hypothetical protein n=1 Tax=Lewinella cohaerens TaxID=70995 RepID=UPI00035FAD30|nr:hypothetical protein [Lewinella cohaerens]
MKKEIPLVVRRALEELLEVRETEIIPFKTDNIVLRLKEVDLSSSFFFDIEEISVKSNKTFYKISYSPFNHENLETGRATVNSVDLKKRLGVWLDFLDAYNKNSLLFDDDQISRQYSEEIGPLFEIIDEDADKAPFSTKQQKVLSNLYDDIIIAVLDSSNSESEFLYAKTIAEEMEISKAAIPRLTKKKNIERLRKHFVKIKKFGVSVFEKTLVKYFSDIGNRLLNGDIDLNNFLP